MTMATPYEDPWVVGRRISYTRKKTDNSLEKFVTRFKPTWERGMAPRLEMLEQAAEKSLDELDEMVAAWAQEASEASADSRPQYSIRDFFNPATTESHTKGSSSLVSGSGSAFVAESTSE